MSCLTTGVNNFDLAMINTAPILKKMSNIVLNEKEWAVKLIPLLENLQEIFKARAARQNPCAGYILDVEKIISLISQKTQDNKKEISDFIERLLISSPDYIFAGESDY